MKNTRRHPDAADPNYAGNDCDQAEEISREANHHETSSVPETSPLNGPSLRLSVTGTSSHPDAIDHTGGAATTDGPLLDEIIALEAAPTSAETPIPSAFKGRSLGVFGPDSNVRLRLSDLLVNPWAEPVILVFILAQTVLLAVEAAPDVWGEGNARPDRWGNTPIDWALFAIFVISTLEITARIIVSRLVQDDPEHSAADRQRGESRGTVVDRIRTLLPLGSSKSDQPPQTGAYGPSAFARSLLITQEPQLPKTVADMQRTGMASKAFLRHTFNRLDFAAVVAFWVSFILGLTGIEHHYHIYLFRMASCLRIIRLMALTSGTAVCHPLLCLYMEF